MPLPKLRQELDLLTGPIQADGQPTWTLHDPVRNLFFRIDWPTLEILQRWDLDDPSQIADEISNTSTLHIEIEDVEEVSRFLTQHHLIQVNSPEHSQSLTKWHSPNSVDKYYCQNLNGRNVNAKSQIHS